MRIRLMLALANVLLQVPATGATQPATTSDGVNALLRGDYVGAAQVLQPIAERSRERDHVAEFFMATLYENGLGVPANITRACALYVRTGFPGPSPFADQAQTLVEQLRKSMTRDAFSDCLLMANTGLDTRFEPASFTIGPDYSVSWDIRGATITRSGRQTRHENLFAFRDAVFLPIRHTELAAGQQHSTPRHFMEVAIWQPWAASQWTLFWHLFEVAGDELVRIITRTVTVSAADPRDAPPVDVREFARVALTPDGNVEWTVFSGPDAGHDVIETIEERFEQRRRALAEARVDWTRRDDVGRPPALAYADAEGCSNLFVYGWSETRTEAISVRASKAFLELSNAPRTFDLAKPPPGLEVIVYVYEHPTRGSVACGGNTVTAYVPEAMWRPTRGRITIQLSEPGVSAREPQAYRATIRLEDAEFMSGTGVRVRQSQPIALSAVVGIPRRRSAWHQSAADARNCGGRSGSSAIRASKARTQARRAAQR